MSFLENTPTREHISLLGIPLDLGKDSVGTDEGPDHLRKFGLIDMLQTVGFTYADLGNIPSPHRATASLGEKNLKYLKEILSVSEEVARIVRKEIEEGHKIMAIGGDHSISFGTVSGASAACNGDIGVVYIDAHGDLMTHENTLSGNIHGMPAASLMGFGHPSLTGIHEPTVKVKPENFLFVGLKDLDQGEIDIIREHKLEAVTIVDILGSGFGQVFEKINQLQKRVKHIWVSLDLDSIDSKYAPATPIINQGGLSLREIVNLTKYIGKTCNIVGCDLVELAPKQDRDERTTKLAVTLLAQLFGAEYNWYTQYMEHEMAKQQARGAAEVV